MVKKYYLSGPMTGLPDNNYPEFNRVSASLRTHGMRVINPAENTPPSCGTWAGWMRKALIQVAMADGVIVLPGWEKSRGAKLEVYVASQLGIPCKKIQDILE